MKLELKNIGKISNAEIEFGGLTVLAGENDTGKSTIGKVLFSLIKAISRQKEDLEEGKEKKIFKKIERLYVSLRRNLRIEIDNDEIYNEFRKLFFPPYFFNELKSYCNLDDFLLIEGDLDYIIGKRKEFIENLNYNHKIDFKNFINELINLQTLIKEKELYITRFNNAFLKVIKSEFYSQITSFNKDNATIYFSDHEIFNIEIKLSKNSTSMMASGFTENNLFPIKDVLFIESPLYLQLYEILNQAEPLFYEEDDSSRFRQRIPLHIKDLANKLSLNKYPNDIENVLIDEIYSIINGKFIYEKDNGQFVFKPKGGNKNNSIKVTNIASGIKSFGIIQLLLDVNEINEQKMLILDEPENHLHPKWQLLFAHILVKMVKKGIPVVVSSHSPYFIQALKHYSLVEDINEITKFYLAEEDKENASMTTFKDSTNDLNSVFIKLAEPLNYLMRGGM